MLTEIEVPEEKKPRGRPSKDLTAFGQWLKTSEDWDRTKIAGALSLSEPYIQNLANGHRAPTKVLALAIEHVTEGRFKVDQWENLSDS